VVARSGWVKRAKAEEEGEDEALSYLKVHGNGTCAPVRRWPDPPMPISGARSNKPRKLGSIGTLRHLQPIGALRRYSIDCK